MKHSYGGVFRCGEEADSGSSILFIIHFAITCRIKRKIEGWSTVKNEPLVIKRRGEDGSRIITVRIREETLAELDRIAAESNYSRNELINIILAHGVKNIEIE